jgi:nucleoside-diphosphate-sugar epimerase
MVVGRGTMAKAFAELADDKHFLIFASGVANSKETLQSEFDRELNLLEENITKHKDLHFVYFSTCSIYDLEESNSPYVKHKLFIEQLIKEKCPVYNIFRVSNVVGFTNNTTTIFNYLVNNIKNQVHFKLWANAYRNILAVDDIRKIATFLLKNKEFANKTINIANPQNYAVTYLVEEIEIFLQISAQYELINRGVLFKIDTTQIETLFPKLGLYFTDKYVQQLLRTYYT